MPSFSSPLLCLSLRVSSLVSRKDSPSVSSQCKSPSRKLLVTASLVLPRTLGSPSLEQRRSLTARGEDWTFRLHTETPPWEDQESLIACSQVLAWHTAFHKGLLDIWLSEWSKRLLHGNLENVSCYFVFKETLGLKQLNV